MILSKIGTSPVNSPQVPPSVFATLPPFWWQLGIKLAVTRIYNGAAGATGREFSRVLGCNYEPVTSATAAMNLSILSMVSPAILMRPDPAM